MDDSTLLLITLLLPLTGAVLVGVPLLSRVAREVALLTTLATLLFAGVVVASFPANGVTGEDYAVSDYGWVSSEDGVAIDVRFSIGLDGLGIWMFGLKMTDRK